MKRVSKGRKVGVCVISAMRLGILRDILAKCFKINVINYHE